MQLLLDSRFQSNNVVSYCKLWKTLPIVTGEKMQLSNDDSQRATFTFPSNGEGSNSISFLNDIKVVWSPNVKNLFAILDQKFDIVNVYHFDSFELQLVGHFNDQLSGISDCWFIGEDNLVLQCFSIPNRILLWNINGNLPIRQIDRVICNFEEGIVAFAEEFFILQQRDLSSSFKDAFSFYRINNTSVEAEHSFITEFSNSSSFWRLSHDGTKLYVVGSPFEDRLVAFHLSGRQAFDFQLKGETSYVASFVEIPSLNILILFDSRHRLYAIDAQTGALVSFAPVDILHVKRASMHPKVQIVRQQHGECITSGEHAEFTLPLPSDSCRRYRMALCEEELLLAFQMDVVSKAVCVFDVHSFTFRSIFLLDAPILLFEWSRSYKALYLVIFTANAVHSWLEEEFFSFSMLSAEQPHELKSVQSIGPFQYCARTVVGKTLSMRLDNL